MRTTYCLIKAERGISSVQCLWLWSKVWASVWRAPAFCLAPPQKLWRETICFKKSTTGPRQWLVAIAASTLPLVSYTILRWCCNVQRGARKTNTTLVSLLNNKAVKSSALSSAADNKTRVDRKMRNIPFSSCRHFTARERLCAPLFDTQYCFEIKREPCTHQFMVLL